MVQKLIENLYSSYKAPSSSIKFMAHSHSQMFSFQQTYIWKSNSSLPGCSSEKLYIKLCNKSAENQTSEQKSYNHKQLTGAVLKKIVPMTFVKSTQKHLYWSLILCFQPATFLKKTLWQKEFFRTFC